MQHCSTIHYTSVGTKRSILSPEEQSKPHIIRNLKITLPYFLTENMWERYSYSLADIYSTLKDTKSYFLWHLALLEFLPITNSSCKCSTDQLNSIIIGSKQVVISKLRRLYQTKCHNRKNLPSVLDQTTDHIPRLPIVSISDPAFFEHLSIRTIGHRYEYYEYSLPYVNDLGYLFVPREKDKGNIWMNRIQEKKEYVKLHGPPESLTMAVGEFKLNDIVYVFLEESYLFKLSHKIQNQGQSDGARPMIY